MKAVKWIVGIVVVLSYLISEIHFFTGKLQVACGIATIAFGVFTLVSFFLSRFKLLPPHGVWNAFSETSWLLFGFGALLAGIDHLIAKGMPGVLGWTALLLLICGLGLRRWRDLGAR